MSLFVGFCIVIHSIPIWFIAGAVATMVEKDRVSRSREEL